MKRFILILLIVATTSTTWAKDTVADAPKNTEKLWTTGSGAHDGSYSAISTSMIGWGVGLAVGIALLAAAFSKPSKSSSSSGHCH
jgi:hypothetical protein